MRQLLVGSVFLLALAIMLGSGPDQDQADRKNVSVDPTKHVPVPIEQSEKNTDKLGLYAKLVGGVWDSKAQWEGGHAPMHARVSYHWMAGGTVIHVFSKVLNKEGKEKLAYETICYWHPGEKQTKFLSFGTGGNLFEGVSTFNADSVEHIWVSHETDGTPVDYKETITLTGPDEYRWIVFRKAGQEWKQIMDSTYTREK